MKTEKKIKVVVPLRIERADDLPEFLSDADEARYSRSAWLLRSGMRVASVTGRDGAQRTVLFPW